MVLLSLLYWLFCLTVSSIAVSYIAANSVVVSAVAVNGATITISIIAVNGATGSVIVVTDIAISGNALSCIAVSLLHWCQWCYCQVHCFQKHWCQ